jgi:glycosyltransferase involved in cell wall biosynthesis
LLLPSRHENFGNVVVEALACGCPVAISDRTGVAGDLLNEAPPDFGMVAPRVMEPWRTWLQHWFRRPRQRASQSAAWVVKRYGQAAVTQQAVEMYRMILQTHRAGGAGP